MKHLLIILFLGCYFGLSLSLQAYDCGHQWKSYKTYSGDTVEECPDVSEWDPKIKPILGQVIRSSNKDTIDVHECRIRLTRIAEYCGQTDYLAYGVPIQTQTNAYKLMPQEDCRKLVENREMNYRYSDNGVETFRTFGIGWFSKDIVVRGSRTDDGTCIGQEFTVDGYHFTQHTLRDIIEGEVITYKLPYNRRKEIVYINGAEIPVSQNYAYKRSTIIWTSPEEKCEENVFQLFVGSGQIYHPSEETKLERPDITDMMLVQNSKHTFGLEIRELTRICNADVFKTNLQVILF